MPKAAAHHVDHAVSPHGVADQAGARCVDEAGQKTARSAGAQPPDLVQHEQLIERPVVERARKVLVIVVGAVGVIDRDGDIPLAGQVLAEMTEQIAVARIAVRDDHQREGSRGGEGRRVAHGLAVQRDGHGRIARDGAVLTAGPLRLAQAGRIPDLEREHAIVACGRRACRGLENVRTVLVGDLDGAHADGVRAEGRELRRRRRDGVDAVVLRERPRRGARHCQRREHQRDGPRHDSAHDRLSTRYDRIARNEGLATAC